MLSINQILRSPITLAEFRYQRYVLRTSRSGWIWIGMALIILIPALLSALYYTALALLSQPYVGAEQIMTFSLINLASVLLIVMNSAQYFVVTLVTLGLAARSISREKTNRTWDALLLTDIDARTLIWGKWWASLRAVWGDHAMIAILRVGLIGWIMTLFNAEWTASAPQLPPGIFDLPSGIAYFLPLIPAIIGITVLDASFSAALGVAAPLSNLPSSSTLPIVMALRVLMMGAIVGLMILIFEWMWMYGGIAFILPALLGVFGIAAATLIVLWVAEQIAVRGQVSPVVKTITG